MTFGCDVQGLCNIQDISRHFLSPQLVVECVGKGEIDESRAVKAVVTYTDCVSNSHSSFSQYDFEARVANRNRSRLETQCNLYVYFGFCQHVFFFSVFFLTR